MAEAVAEHPVAKQASVSVRLPIEVVEKVRVISALQGREMGEIILEVLGPPIDKMWRHEIAKAAKKAAGDK